MSASTLFLDIETYSRVDLMAAGVYAYTEDDEFQILMAAWAFDDDPVQVELQPEKIAALLDLADAHRVERAVAHNAQFERVCFSAHLGLPVGQYLEPELWHDTMAVAAEHGYPQKLESLAKALGGEQKDTAGTALVNFFCKPNRKGQRNLPEDHPEKWAAFVEYCRQDVVTLRDVDKKLGDFPNEAERQAWIVDQRINDRGIRLDRHMATLAVEAADDNRMNQELEIMGLTGVANPGSQPQMMAWARERELPLPNLQAESVKNCLESLHPDSDEHKVLTLRQELALVASKKYSAALVGVSKDDRLRGQFRFFGAHTGRWSGRGVQLQNLPRPTGKWEKAEEHEFLAAIVDLKLGHGAGAEVLKALVRSLFDGPFTVCDYSAIEARVVAWLAGEQWALDAFRAGRDIYVETAQRMGGLSRSQGKVAVLALGYNGAVNSLRAMGAEGNDDTLKRMVVQWRSANRKIVQLWADLGNAVSDTGRVGQFLRVSREGEDIFLHLPSGRAITYHGMRWERYRVADPDTGKFISKEGWRYDDPRGQGRIGTYGGRLTENATQAVARDLLAEALTRLEERGYSVAGHIHDEVLVEGRHPVDKICSIISESPDWATGLPVDASGFQCSRYMKGA